MENIADYLQKEDDKTLPLIPLRDTVLFPFTSLPIFVGRDRSVKAFNKALEKGKHVILTSQKNPDLDEPQTQDMYQIGVLARIVDQTETDKEPIQAFVEVEERVKITNLKEKNGFLQAEYELYPDKPSEKDAEVEALARTVRERFQQVVLNGKTVPLEWTVNIMRNDQIEPAKLSYAIPQILNLELDEKQKILEITDVSERLRLIMKYLAKELEVINVQEKVKKETTEQLSKMQREVILREQLKAIEKELGIQDEREDYSELQKKIDAAAMPEEVEKKAKSELNRLRKMTSASPEASYIRTYLDWMVDIPWSKKSETRIDLKKAEQILDDDHYGLDKVKERILEYLAVHKLSKNLKGPILCFVGPPGVGKTSIGNSIAKALNREFIRMSLGGVRDEAEIRGHRRTYVGAMPGRIIQGIKNSGTKNPVFMLDEIDKVGNDFRGDPSSALLEALDPEQNNNFSDHYLEVPFDLSDVLFIGTANTLDTIPPALRDRLEIIEFSGYTIDEKEAIAKQYLWPKVLENHGLKDEMQITKKALHHIITKYTREAGVRTLERQLASVARKIARKKVEGGKVPARITMKVVKSTLGSEKYPHLLSAEKDEVGIATGLAWTQAGGEILFIEAALMPGKGNLIITGSLGDVMKESARAALSYVRSRAETLNIDKDFLDKRDIHVHVPAGAIPKDGPSAGIAIATAVASIATGIPIRKEVGLTGEVTITGRALEVGGIKEKVIAASRAGVKEVIIPKENEKNLEDVPKEVLDELKIHFVNNMDEALPIALKEKIRKPSSKTPAGSVHSSPMAAA